MENEKIVQRLDALISLRKATVEETWTKIEQYVAPIRGGKFYEDSQSESQVEHDRPEIFDDTAITGADTLASAIHGALTSPALQWFGLRFRDDKLNGDNESMEWLEKCADEVYYAIQDSNFNTEISESYLDLVGFGNTCLVEEEVNPDAWEGIDFAAVPLREVYFDEGHKGQIRNFYRRLQWTALKIVDKFGEANVPEHIVEASKKAGQADVKYDVIFCVYTRDNEMPPLGQKVAANLRPFGWKYVLKKGQETLGEEGGYYEMPAYIGRWRKTSGSMWGYGCGNLAINTVITINTYTELVLNSAEKAIDPATLVTERGLISDLDLSAGGVTVVRNLENSMKSYESRARFDVSGIEVEKLKAQVRAIFRTDQLELKDSPAMTATEASIRYELMNRLLGPTLGRIQNDILSPTIQRTFNILFRAGRLPDMPDAVKEGGEVDIEYSGPLSRAQKMDSVTSTERWLGTMANFAEIFPDLMDLPDVDELGRDMAAKMGVPANSLRSKDEVNKLRKDREAAQKQAQEAALAKAEGEAKIAQGEGNQAMQGEMPLQ